ncbi:MAG: hypothetical protein ACI8YO_002214 [Gammaproteobacteria bacterium]|jgi:hypothetical protein
MRISLIQISISLFLLGACTESHPTDYYLELDFVDQEVITVRQDSTSKSTMFYANNSLDNGAFEYVTQFEFVRNDTSYHSYHSTYIYPDTDYYVTELTNYSKVSKLRDYHVEKDTSRAIESKFYEIEGKGYLVYKVTSVDWKTPACKSEFINEELGFLTSRGNAGRYLSYPTEESAIKTKLIDRIHADKGFLYCGEEQERYEKWKGLSE